MSCPHCCPIARNLGKITLLALFAIGSLLAVALVRAEDKDKQTDRPKDAVVLFDGKDLSKWQAYPDGGAAKWKVADGYMEVAGGDIITKDKFKDMKLHLEFMPPYMPDARGQARGNSGVFIMNNYEVQVLDSYGLPRLEVGDCAALYSKKTPDKNAAKPPAHWQTYDIDFTAAKFNDKGEKTADAMLTVHHNGVVVYQDQKIDHTTTAAPHGKEIPEGQPHYLQDHGHEVCFRNVWLVER